MTQKDKALNCLNCRIGDFKHSLCDCHNGFCAKYKGIGKQEDFFMAIETLSKPNYESDNEVRLAVTNRNKEKVILWDAFGEVEYYPNGEINCVHCPRYYETEDDIGVHSHCGSHGRLIDADALKEYCENQKSKTISNNDIARFPTIIADRPMWETCFACPLSNCCPKIQGATNEDTQKYASEVPEGCPIDRPQGEWIDKGDDAECSICGAHSGTQFDGVEPIPLKTKFCHNCGARMKGDENE